MGRREQKKDQTRLDLIQAAVELFEERGFETTTVEDITDRANYSRMTFFRHFVDKEDVVFDLARERFRVLAAEFERAAEDPDAFGLIGDQLIEVSVSMLGAGSGLLGRCAVLWSKEPALHRRYYEFTMDGEIAIRAALAKAWNVEPSASVACITVAAAIAGLCRFVIGAQLSDEGVRDLLREGFEILEEGAHRWPPSARADSGRTLRPA